MDDTYIALLRGINVGGNNKIDMKALKLAFEQAGFTAVKTYINSGNILFKSGHLPKKELGPITEKAILEHFGLNIKVLIYAAKEFLSIAKALPENWVNDKEMKSDVLFLWEEVDDEKIMEQLQLKPEVDQVIYVPGAILWTVARENVAKSGMVKIVGTDIYRKVTIRNVNTVRKLAGLIEDLG
ncbi:DUF1697 domain-containing protein [Planococcus ruber]|uniref:DUF1697 domain-containing protein n=1 Tax=Planococcus ruber TaxID=2027871 RepID=UPI001FEDA52C|nr:DUF1697 domain-containing protein [Planococcus ruber]MCJ1910081.1 DUF1697 domain-containing protein [Planococcus ruber]